MAKKAMFGLGCFWDPDEHFSKLDGVKNVVVGYSGGEKEDPTYENYHGHTEVVEIEYDPKIISYKELLKHFWGEHDSTTACPVEYKSVIFTNNEIEKKLAKESKEKEGKGVLTEILPVEKFWRAEEYHQKYFHKMKNKLP